MGRLALCGLGVVLVLAAYVTYQLTVNPAFGSQPSGERLARMQQSAQWRDGQFVNPQPQWSDLRSAWLHFLFGEATPNAAPTEPVPVVRTDARARAVPPASGLRVTWFGHSSALVEIEQAAVLIDPMWSERPSPISWIGPKPFYAPPIELDALKQRVDAVVISHDHFDHLDHATIVAMQSWRAVFVVPLGIGAHLQRWGIPESRIRELDWWQSTQVDGLGVVVTPARHSSGRLSYGPRPLWAGFALVGREHRVWYSGDTGFHSTLAEIGQRLGPFDLTLIDAGQYDADWPDAHLGPELAVEAHRQVRGKVMMPVHWAFLVQANHAWTEPVERVLAAARCHAVEVVTPAPGQSIEPSSAPRGDAWWPRHIGWQSATDRPVRVTKNGLATERIGVPACSAPREPAAS